MSRKIKKPKSSLRKYLSLVVIVIGVLVAVALTQKSQDTRTKAAASSQIYWGARIDGDVYGTTDAPWNQTTWDTFEQHAGKKISIEHFGQDAPWDGTAFAATPYDLTVNRGAIPLVSVRSKYAKLTDIATVNGPYDASIKTWATAVKNWGKPFLMRWDWEMNGTWDLGGDWGKQAAASPQSYVAAWRHFHDLVVSQGATNVTWVWCPNTEFPGSTLLSSLYPGDDYVDWTCIDGYNWGTNPMKPVGWQSFSQVMGQTYNSLLTIAPNKPIIIGETSSSEYGGNKASWITDALGTQLPNNFKQIKALVWFNWNVVGNSAGDRWDWPIESSAAQTAFANAIASSYYATNTFGNLQPLTKVNPIPDAITPTPTAVPPTSTPTSLPPSTPTSIAVDTIPPSVIIVAPSNGSTVPRGSNVTITTSASDNVGVTKVEFYINNVLKSSDTTYPYTYSWNVPSKPNVTYTFKAIAHDAANNSTPMTVSVTVR